MPPRALKPFPAIDALRPAHAPAHIDAMRDSIRKLGCLSPILCWGPFILDGHLRYEICAEFGREVARVEVNLPDRAAAEAFIRLCHAATPVVPEKKPRGLANFIAKDLVDHIDERKAWSDARIAKSFGRGATRDDVRRAKKQIDRERAKLGKPKLRWPKQRRGLRGAIATKNIGRRK